MFLKIRIRAALLQCWAPTRFKNFSHPLSEYIYYEALTAWMPIIKQMKKEGAKIEDIVPEFIGNVLDGICPDKFYKAAISDEPYKMKDLVDQNLLLHIDALAGGDDKVKSMMRGTAYSLKYGR
jgi:hypothetical protein